MESFVKLVSKVKAKTHCTPATLLRLSNLMIECYSHTIFPKYSLTGIFDLSKLIKYNVVLGMSWNWRGWLQVLALLLTSFMIWAELPRFALCKDNLHKHAWSRHCWWVYYLQDLVSGTELNSLGYWRMSWKNNKVFYATVDLLSLWSRKLDKGLLIFITNSS